MLPGLRNSLNSSLETSKESKSPRTMKKTTLFFSFFLIAIFFSACSKELSVETTGFGGTAKGTLTDSAGNCKNIVVKGSYVVGQSVGDSNYALINVNFTAQGKYKIKTDTVNGLWFIDSGFATKTGSVLVKVLAKGKPILPQRSNFVVTFNGSVCTFSLSSSNPGANNDYFPNTFGSSWTYQFVPPLQTPPNWFTTTVLTSTYPIDTLTYFEFQQTDSMNNKASYYFAKDGKGNYFAYSTIEFDYTTVLDSIVPVSKSYVSYPFMKESANVGETWTVQQPGTSWYKGKSGTSQALFTVIQKGTPYTAGGTTYSDVIAMKREIQFQASGSTTGFAKITEGTAYYARGTGLVDQQFPPRNGGSTTQAITLKTATIK